MRLDVYLEKRQESAWAFAKRCEVHPRSLFAIAYEGREPGAKTAHKIIEASREEPGPDGETVTLADLTQEG